MHGCKPASGDQVNGKVRDRKITGIKLHQKSLCVLTKQFVQNMVFWVVATPETLEMS